MTDDAHQIEWRPRGELAAMVASVCDYAMPPLPGGVHRGMPSPWLTVILSLHDPVPVLTPVDVGPVRTDFRTFVGGLHRRAALLPQEGPQAGVEIQVHPLAAPALFGVRASELAGRVVDLTDLTGSWADDVSDVLAELPPGPRRFRHLGGRLAARLQRVSRAARPRAELARAWELLAHHDGRVKVEDAAAEVGWSRRHLAEQLRLATGFGPKDVARTARFQRSGRLIRGQAGSLADIAATCGYADQPHMTAEWRAFAGCTPGAWLADEAPSLAGFSFFQDGEHDEAPR